MSATVDTRTEVRSFQVDIPEANIDDPVGNAFAPPPLTRSSRYKVVPV